LLLLLLTGCSSAPGPDASPTPGPTPSGNPGDDGVGPYVSVAVDNHFHDIHPENHIAIPGTRTFIVKNEGSNLHNVTIVGTDVDDNIRPGASFRLSPSGDTLDPGTYTIICKFHGNTGMRGEITITP
jgi:plastocyanin